MTHQRGGSAGFFAVLLGRNTDSQYQTAEHADALSRNTNQLSNQLTSGPSTHTAGVLAAKAQPPPRVSGQTAFEAALNNATSKTDRSKQSLDTSQGASQEASNNYRHAYKQPATTQPASKPGADAVRQSRKVAFNTPANSIRRLKQSSESSLNQRDETTHRRNAPAPAPSPRPSAERRSGSSKEVPSRTERGESRGTAQNSSRANGYATHERGQQPRESREANAERSQRPSGPDRTRTSSSGQQAQSRQRYPPAQDRNGDDRIQRPPGPDRHRLSASSQRTDVKQKDGYDPSSRRPVPSFLPPVSSTAGKFDSIDEPRARERSQDWFDREPLRGSSEQMRRPTIKTHAGEPRTSRDRDIATSRHEMSHTNRSKERPRPERVRDERADYQRPSSNRPAHLFNNVSRNPLSSNPDRRPTVSQGQM